MTREEILNMPAGREIDLLIADKVMGFVWDETRCRVCGWPLSGDPKNGCIKDLCSMRPLPNPRADDPLQYSTDVAAAWEIVKRASAFTVHNITCQEESVAGIVRWTAEIFIEKIEKWGLGEADAAPLAICRAALLAVMAL